ncbi:MAG: hypothetical protein ABI136_01680 [Ginsengibacter sp.]
MDDDLLNILSNSNKDIDNQKLMDYLSDKLSVAEKHEFEKSLLDSEMESDAIEGLSQFKNKKDPVAFAEELNLKLKLQLEKKKSSKNKRAIKELRWLYVAITLIIIFILIAFVMVSKFLK